MKFLTQQLFSKNNKAITIREAIPSDGQALLNLKLSYLDGSTTIPLLSSEYVRDQESESSMIQSYLEQENSIILLAEFEGALIGNLDLTSSERIRMQHTAMLGMGVATSWQNEGVGSLLLDQSIKWAKTAPTLELIWLDVYSSNSGGLALYTKLGFVESGRIPQYFRHVDQYFDKVQMYLPLK